MATNGPLTFKVYINWDEQQPPEVRRFVLPNGTRIYAHFIKKLHLVVPLLEAKKYTVTWNDEEGDEVTIALDEEMKLAIDSLMVNVNGSLKMNININVDNSGPVERRTSGIGGLHNGVPCTECGGDIHGFLYKCTICANHNMCSRCENEANHEDHVVVRFASPAMAGYYTALSPPSYVLGWPNQMIPQPQQWDPCQCELTQQMCDPRQCPNEQHRWNTQQTQNRSGWLNLVNSYMNNFANLAGDIGLNNSHTQTHDADMRQGQRGFPSSEDGTYEQQEAMPSRPQISTSCPAGGYNPGPRPFGCSQPVDYQALRAHIMESMPQGNGVSSQPAGQLSCTCQSQGPQGPMVQGPMAQSPMAQGPMVQGPMAQSPMAQGPKAQGPISQGPSTQGPVTLRHYTYQPFGSYNVTTPQVHGVQISGSQASETQNEKNQAAEPQSTNPEATLELTKTQNSRAGNGASLIGHIGTAHAAAHEGSQSEATALPAARREAGHTVPVATVTQASLSSSEASPAAARALSVPARPQPDGEHEYCPGAPHTEPSTNEDWIVVPQVEDRNAEGPAAEDLSVPVVSSRSSLTESQRELLPHIESALRGMLAMGFNNEDGWLARLLEERHGYVMAVLELLAPYGP